VPGSAPPDATDVDDVSDDAALSTADRLAIDQLNATYFHAIDGLLGADSDARWAGTFTPDGTFTLVDATGALVAEAAGTDALVEAWSTFPAVATTRHWSDNHLVSRDGHGVSASCYIVALEVGVSPATISRTGVYTDQLVEVGGRWLYQHRTLTLDPNSPRPT